MTVQLEYINHLSKIFPIMLALCLMLFLVHRDYRIRGYFRGVLIFVGNL